MIGLTMRGVTGNRSPIKNLRLISCLFHQWSEDTGSRPHLQYQWCMTSGFVNSAYSILQSTKLFCVILLIWSPYCYEKCL